MKIKIVLYYTVDNEYHHYVKTVYRVLECTLAEYVKGKYREDINNYMQSAYSLPGRGIEIYHNPDVFQPELLTEHTGK